MTVPVQTPVNAYIANGATSTFAYTFLITDEDDLAVLIGGIRQTSGYTVSQVGDPAGGNVVFAANPANGAKILIYLDQRLTRENDFQQFGDWEAHTVNLEFDRVWLAMQSVSSRADYAIRAPIADGVKPAELQSISVRAGKYATFDANGNIVASTGTGNDSALRADLALNTGSSLSGFNNGQVGGKNRSAQDELRETLRVNDFTGADPTGVSDSTAAFAAAVAVAAVTGQMIECNGDYLLNGATSTNGDGTKNGIFVPFTSANNIGPRVRFCGRARFKCGSDNMILMRYSDAHGGFSVAPSAFQFDPNGHTGCTALAVVPESMTQTTTVVHQIWNVFRGYYINGFAEGIVLQAGPHAGGVDGSCSYNVFDGHNYNNTRCFWLKDHAGATPSSGCNANIIAGVIGHGNCNTGVQIDSGSGNEISADIEGVLFGTSPNTVPTGVKIANTGASGLSNDNNELVHVRNEANTRELQNANASTKIFAGFWRETLWGGTGHVAPQWAVGNDPSWAAFRAPWGEHGEGISGAASGYFGMKKVFADVGFQPVTDTTWDAAGDFTNVTSLTGITTSIATSASNMVDWQFNVKFRATTGNVRVTIKAASVPIAPLASIYKTPDSDNLLWNAYVNNGTNRSQALCGFDSSGNFVVLVPSGGNFDTTGNNNIISFDVRYRRA